MNAIGSGIGDRFVGWVRSIVGDSSDERVAAAAPRVDDAANDVARASAIVLGADNDWGPVSVRDMREAVRHLRSARETISNTELEVEDVRFNEWSSSHSDDVFEPSIEALNDAISGFETLIREEGGDGRITRRELFRSAAWLDEGTQFMFAGQELHALAESTARVVAGDRPNPTGGHPGVMGFFERAEQFE